MTKCNFKDCDNECLRRGQEYCSDKHRLAAWKRSRKRRLRPATGESEKAVPNGLFSLIKSKAQNADSTFTYPLPEGRTLKVRLGHDERGKCKVGDERHWRLSVEELVRQQKKPPITRWNPTAAALNRPIIVVGRNEPIKNMDDALGVPKGFRVRLCIESEKELQVLGCGWRTVTCQTRGKTVLLHHHGNVATMKRKALKDLIAANKASAASAVR